MAELYQGAVRDYNSARYDLAAGEFGDVLKYYPNDDLAGNAQFYLGEIAYRQGKYSDAIKAYNVVLQQFAGNPKAPAAALRKGEAELSLDQRENGIRDLRALIARYPQTPEASQARSRLNGMGVRISASKPSGVSAVTKAVGGGRAGSGSANTVGGTCGSAQIGRLNSILFRRVKRICRGEEFPLDMRGERS